MTTKMNVRRTVQDELDQVNRSLDEFDLVMVRAERAIKEKMAK